MPTDFQNFIPHDSFSDKDDFFYSPELYKRIVDNMIDVYYQTDLAGNLTMLSPSGAKMFGVDKIEQLLGKNVIDFYSDPEERNIFKHDLLTKGKLRRKVLLKTVDGQKKILEANSKLMIANGQPIGTEGILRDINEEERAKFNLKLTQEKYKLLAENMTDNIWMMDLNGNILYSSPSVKKLIGYEKYEIEKMNLAQIVTPNSYQRVRKIVSEAVKEYKQHQNKDIQEKHTNIILTAIKKNGLELEIEVNARIFVKENGEINIIGSNRDISDRVIAQKKSFDHENRFRKIFENASIGMAVIGVDGLFLEINKAFARMIGYSELDATRLSLSEVILPENNNEDLLADLSTSNTDTATHERRIQRSDCKIGWTIVNITLIKNEENIPQFFIAQIQDITKRVKAETDLQKFKTIADRANYGVMMTNLDGKIIYANKYLAEMHGYKLTELAGKSWDVFYNPFQWKQVEELNKSLLTNGSYDAIEVRHTHKNGNSFPTLMSAQLMQNKNDNSQFITATIIDISDQKKAEEKLIAAQKMDSIGNLAGGIAHDFNNMLGGISGYASILVAETNVDKHKEYAETIINITEKANGLTKRLLSFGKKSFKAKVNLNINQAVEEILLIIKHSFDKNIKIKTKLNKQIYQIAADPTQINQVIMNLCVNAFEAMPTGGTIKITTDNVAIDRQHNIGLENPNSGNYVMIQVSDNGIGMDKETKQRIFEPFFTTKKTNKKSGSGLGLATSYAIINNLKGFIEVDSELNKGTTFRIYIPAQEIIASSNNIILKDRIITGKGNILIVDDEPTILKMAEAMIKSLGYTTRKARGGKKAIEIYKNHYHDIDAIVIDWQMPDLNGADTIRQILAINQNAQIILSTGFDENCLDIDGLTDKLSGILTKPYRLSQMSSQLAKIFGK